VEARAAVAADAAAVAAAAAADGGDWENDMTRHNSQHIEFKAVLAAALVASALSFAPGALAQKAYPTPDAAADAFVDSLARHDVDALKRVVGTDYKKYMPNVDADDVTSFLEAWAKSHKIVASGNDKSYLQVGPNGWTLPIPLVKTKAGWEFDTKAAPEEIRMRRIGKNELDAIQVSLALTDAQDDFYKFDRDRNGRQDYAQRILSTPGKHDGLYWASKPGQFESPIGSLVAKADPKNGYHGYRFRVLTAQGKEAPGGAKSYIANGAMTGGYAFVAWPARWGDTGVMTFMVDRDQVVWEKDLGPDTDKLARAISSFNPDSSWRKVPAAEK
jgi:Protein of unknown function (DUF2950)